MKAKTFFLAALLVTLATIFVSCSRDDDSNTPLTNESIVGRKYFSDKVYKWEEEFVYRDHWEQTEILFAENNTAYLTCIKTYCETGNTTRSEVKKASFNLAYPNVIFESLNSNGNTVSHYATFTDNNTLVFDGGQQRSLEMYGVPTEWSNLSGIRFCTTSHAYAGPYTGQVFMHEYRDALDSLHYETIGLGVDYAYYSEGWYTNFLYTLEIDYPNIKMTPINNSGIVDRSLTGHFVDANTILIGENSTFTRTR